MMVILPLALLNLLAALAHHQVCRVNILGADRGAQAAEAALKGNVFSLIFKDILGKTMRAAVFA